MNKMNINISLSKEALCRLKLIKEEYLYDSYGEIIEAILENIDEETLEGILICDIVEKDDGTRYLLEDVLNEVENKNNK